MRCPFCGHEDSQVKDSRPNEDGGAIRRRREFEGCGARFTPCERIQLRDLYILKKDGARQAFDRNKLERSIAIACRKRPIDPDRIDRLVSAIQRQIETSGESEIPADSVGQMVMDGLKALESVAYIRFASVYKDFTEARDFEAIADAVQEGGEA